MKTLAIILLSTAFGWLSCLSVDAALQRIHDWHRPALLAGICAIVIAALLLP